MDVIHHGAQWISVGGVRLSKEHFTMLMSVGGVRYRALYFAKKMKHYMQQLDLIRFDKM